MVHELCSQHMMLYELLHTLWWLFCLFVFWHYLKSGQNILLNHLLGSTEGKKSDMV